MRFAWASSALVIVSKSARCRSSRSETVDDPLHVLLLCIGRGLPGVREQRFGQAAGWLRCLFGLAAPVNLRQHQREHPLEHVGVAPEEDVKSLVEQLELLVAIEKQGG